MRKSVFLALIAIVIATDSCKKNDEASTEPITPDFMNLRVGNYWVYALYKTDTNGTETKLEETDSAYIQSDTVINGLTYFIKILDNQYSLQKGALLPLTQLLRDSSGYLVDNFGKVLFANDNFTDTLNIDTIAGMTWNFTKMTGKDSLVYVPAGSYISRTISSTWYPLVPDYHWGIRKSYTVFGKNVGILKYNYWFYNSGINYDARLLRYKK